MHGDLAARNILLEDELIYGRRIVAKISDFGLSKRMYTDLNTPQSLKSVNEEQSLPVAYKWMAIEILLRQEVIPVKSDSWSFGVLLWEIFEYGKEPYRESKKNTRIEYLDSV